MEINRAWETIGQNIIISVRENLGYYELKQHKTWFDEECAKLLGHTKQTKLQWLQNPSQMNGDNLNNVRCVACTHFRMPVDISGTKRGNV
jgi:hypothetical protein